MDLSCSCKWMDKCVCWRFWWILIWKVVCIQLFSCTSPAFICGFGSLLFVWFEYFQKGLLCDILNQQYHPILYSVDIVKMILAALVWQRTRLTVSPAASPVWHHHWISHSPLSILSKNCTPSIFCFSQCSKNRLYKLNLFCLNKTGIHAED